MKTTTEIQMQRSGNIRCSKESATSLSSLQQVYHLKYDSRCKKMLFLQPIFGPLILLPTLETAVSYLKASFSLLLQKILPPYSMKPDCGVCRD